MGTLEQIWGPNGVLGTQKLKKVPMGTGSQMGTHVGEVYMAWAEFLWVSFLPTLL